MTSALYEKVWQHEAYRRFAPGEWRADHFCELAKPSGKVIDFGCGTGRGATRIAALTGCEVLGLDFARNCLDEGVGIELRQHDLRDPISGPPADFGYCTDVMEHIAPEDVDRVITNIISAARKVYFNISTVPDALGVLVGEPLHLTVESPYWWHDKLSSLGFRVDWSTSDDASVTLYGSGWANGADFEELSKLNVAEEKALANIKRNLDLRLLEVAPHEVQDTEVWLLAGGPSLGDYEAEIVEAGRNGVPMVTVNGTYGWLLDRGIKPAAQVMVDARESNRKFITRHVDTCKYLIGSQCDHELVASLPREQTLLWHSGQSELVKRAVDEWAGDAKYQWWPVAGASTVISRAITLLAMLGFRKIQVFGWDSCLRDDKHHAYEQPENDQRGTVEIAVGNRKFRCHPWMIVQAAEFPKLVRHVWSAVPDLELNIRGDGLIAAMLEEAGARNGC